MIYDFDVQDNGKTMSCMAEIRINDPESHEMDPGWKNNGATRAKMGGKVKWTLLGIINRELMVYIK